MLLLVVWIAVAVVVVVVLGSLVFGLVGALTRLGREVAALDAELRPVLAQVQATSERISAANADQERARA